MSGTENLYIIDTSSLIQIKDRYPVRTLPGIWDDLNTLIVNKRLIAPEEVKKEILDGNDVLVPWVHEHDRMFRSNRHLIALTRIPVLEKFPEIANYNTEKRHHADPFVIALGMKIRDNPQKALITFEPVIVSDEKSDLVKNPKLPVSQVKKIPDVCAHFGLRCINHLEMFKQEGFRFH
jgi:hypothetical protein